MAVVERKLTYIRMQNLIKIHHAVQELAQTPYIYFTWHNDWLCCINYIIGSDPDMTLESKVMIKYT